MPEIIMKTLGVEAVGLREAHIDGIIALMDKEGWYYYDRHELNRYLDLNQKCFALLRNGCIAGSIFTTSYGNQAWIGNIILAEDLRGMGLAARLIRSVIDDMRETRHIPTFRLASVPLAIGLYKRVGFRAEAFATSQEAALPLNVDDEEMNLGKDIQIERFDAHDLDAIGEIDQRYFKSDRLKFLENVYQDSIKETCLCMKDRGKVVGFLMVRRRRASKDSGFAEGPDFVYRLGPSCVLPEYGIHGFKALFQEALRSVDARVRQHGGSAKLYAVFPKNADKAEIYEDTRRLAKAVGMDANIDLDRVFDEHDHIFGARKSKKNEDQWKYMKRLGFHQEYFEQVMSYTPGEAADTPPARRKAAETMADPEGIFASATPGDKA